MKRAHAIPAVLVLAAVLGTAAVVALRQPDVVHAVGDNGRVTVDGRGVGEVVIANAGERDHAGIAVEDISMNGLPVPANFLLTFSYDPAIRAKAPRPLSLFAFDASLGVWRSVPTADDPVTSTLSGYAAVASRRWTYASVPDGVGSEASVIFDSLVSFPPAGAVGYRALAAVQQGEGDFFLVNGEFGRGGCGGTFERGRTQTVTSRDAGGKRYEVQWEIADGCVAGEKVL